MTRPDTASNEKREREALAPYLAIAHARLVVWIGVDLGRGGVTRAVERQVARYVAERKPSVGAYAASLDSPASPAGRALIEAATVPHSWLFRDPAQLETLAQALRERAPALAALQVLVAGCAHGEDAYSIASIAGACGHDVRVLAIDVNESALERARRGVFGAFEGRDVPRSARADFARTSGGETVASEALQRRIEFRRHSLVDAIPRTPDGGSWDLVVCRNVLIYFEREPAYGLVSRLGAALREGGLLMLGASDVLAELPVGLVARADAGRALLVRDTTAGARRLAASIRAERATPPPPSTPSTPSTPTAPRGATPEASPPVDPLVAALDAGELDHALALAHARIEVTPADGETRLLAGLVAFAREDHRSAVDHLELACHRLPGAWVAWFHLGLSYERLGRWSEAARAYWRVPLATGRGEELPRAPGELAIALHASRPSLARLAMRRAASLERGESPP